MKYRIAIPLMIALLAWLGPVPATNSKPVRVLVLSGTPQTVEHGFYDSVPIAAMIAENYSNPLAIGDPDISGRRVRYHTLDEWSKAIQDLKKYDVVVIWDVPRQLTQDKAHVRDLLPSAWMDKLAQFVKDGGGLVVNGGVACYGTGNFLGASSSKTKEMAEMLIYTGWQNSKLADLLPVTLPEGYSLEKPGVGYRPATAGRDYDVAEYGPAEHPLVLGLAWDKRPLTAAHYLKLKPDAKAILSAKFGKNKEERPLIASVQVGKGRVLAIAFSAVARAHQAGGFNEQIFWTDDAVLWDRAVKWAAGQDDLAANKTSEDAVRARFAQQLFDFSGEKQLPEWLREEFPYSVRILEADSAGAVTRPMIFKLFKDMGFQYLSTCSGPTPSIMYSAEKADVLMVQSINPCGAIGGKPDPNDPKKKLDPKEYSQILNTGEISTSYYGGPGACPRNPKMRAAGAEACKAYQDACAENPRIHSYMLDDEFGWDLGYVPDKGIACYCESCKAFYKGKTGKEAPLPIFREPGYVAPLNDPWMNWVRTVRMNAYDPYQAEMGKILKAKAPRVKVTGYPGGYFGGLDLINEEYYLDYWTVSDLTACHHSDYRFATVGDMAGSKHELWGMLALLRQFEQDIRSGISQETLRLTSGCMLGSGVRGIHLWASTWITKSPGEFGQEALWPEVQALAQKLKVFGPMFRALTRVEAPVWMMGGWLHGSPHDAYLLLPLPTPERRKEDPEWQWSQYQVEDIAYPALMRAGVQVHAITANMLMTDELFKKKAVVLPRLWFAEQVWLDRLQEFTKKGGKVYVDESCKVSIPGAIKVPFDFDRYHREVVAGKRKLNNYANFCASWKLREDLVDAAIPALKDTVAKDVPAPVTTGSDRCCYTLMENGDCRYLFVYNQDKYAPHSFTVKFAESPGAVYDLGVDQSERTLPGKLLEGSDLKTGEMPAGGWKVYLLAPQPFETLKGSLALAGGFVKADLTLTGKDGKPFRGAVPLRIELTRKSGMPLLFYRTTNAGEAKIEIPLKQYGDSITGGTVVELLTGKSIAQKL